MLWLLVALVAALVLVMLVMLTFMVFVYWRESRRDAQSQRRFEEFAREVAPHNGGPHHPQTVARRPPRDE